MDFHEIFRKCSRNLAEIKTKKFSLGLLLGIVLLMNKIILISMNLTVLIYAKHDFS